MRRREFIGLIGTTWLASLRAAQAQKDRVPVLGFLNTGSEQQYTRLLRAFKAGLQDAGFAEGENLKIDYKWANNQRALLQPMAKQLVADKVDLIAATGGSPAALAAKAATTDIPIVFAIGVDPVKVGLVPSLAHPVQTLPAARCWPLTWAPSGWSCCRVSCRMQKLLQP